MRDHGGDLDRAIVTWGAGPWLDLSTGINRTAYPVPALNQRVWTDLPTRADMAALRAAAKAYFDTPADVVPLAGAQSAIQLLPGLRKGDQMRMISPTYNEYSAVFQVAGWQVTAVDSLEGLVGADVAIVVNPNNPDGRRWSCAALADLVGRVGLLVVDESFMDMTPEQSLAPQAGVKGLIILRSFGKFFGLAGVRLGFALGDPDLCAQMAHAVGPWPVSGAAIAVGITAMRDQMWTDAAKTDLASAAAQMDAMLPWVKIGGCDLFALYDVGDAGAIQAVLAAQHIWTRRFPWSNRLLRLGVPALADLPRLQQAVRASDLGHLSL
ncbi:threonine-phosphate decarboxylase CobD [Falsigemmobacter faecalis]|uniref:threonine-phosphate decarboxylase n=1 Tax=Falsigemmobacter faecalis TaxID=2488730 RepID=A0A3P3DCS4_9RHOB|nr:threonine-phosphate decarboxylase CobD [Falsigemmobacter faecalis]RRH72051.1 threonine-phosphate decarboxylase [Falsigemmobacter faecalis]